MIFKTETSEIPCRIIAQTVKNLKYNKTASRIPKFGKPFYSSTVGAK